MKGIHGFTALAALLVLGVDAQSTPSIPTCAEDCVTSTLGSAGCKSDDISCICSSTTFISQISCCIIPVCSSADIQQAIDYADTLCGANGVTNLPKSATCASTAAAAYTTGSVSSSTSLLIETQPVPSCFNLDPSATTSCLLRPVPQTATNVATSSASSASSLTGAAAASVSSAESSLASSLASASSASSTDSAASSSGTTAVAAGTTSAGSASTTDQRSVMSTSDSTAARESSTAASTAASTSAATSTSAAATTSAAAASAMGNVNSIGMGFAGGAVGLVAGLVGVLL